MNELGSNKINTYLSVEKMIKTIRQNKQILKSLTKLSQFKN